MKTLRTLAALLFCAATAAAQTDLTALPRAQRDSALTAIVQNLLLRKFPTEYREEVHPIVAESRVDSFMAWLKEDKKGAKDLYELPPYVKPGDVTYSVELAYEHWNEDGFEWDYTARATVVGKTGEVSRLSFGGNMKFYTWRTLPQVPDVPAEQRRLCALPLAQRDSVLADIVRTTLQSQCPELWRGGCLLHVVETDFAPLRLKWKQQDGSVPDYVNPADIQYQVSLLDTVRRQPVCTVHIIEKTREAYKIVSQFPGESQRWLLVPRVSSLASLPPAERDSTLAEIVQRFLLADFPERYRKRVFPIVSQGDFLDEGIEFGAQARPAFPNCLQWQDTCYHVTLYYPRWREEGFAYPYTAQATIHAKSWKMCDFLLGGTQAIGCGFGKDAYYNTPGFTFTFRDTLRREPLVEIAWESLSPLPAAPQADGSRPTALPATRRDSLLVARARQEVLKEVPRWPVDDCLPTIEQGDFGVLRLDWVPRDKHLPADVQPTDRYYQVTFVDKRWRERKYMFGPSRISVCLVERTQEAYNVQYDYTMIAWLDGQLGNAQ